VWLAVPQLSTSAVRIRSSACSRWTAATLRTSLIRCGSGVVLYRNFIGKFDFKIFVKSF